jgi:PAS domain S-box-containing protein
MPGEAAARRDSSVVPRAAVVLRAVPAAALVVHRSTLTIVDATREAADALGTRATELVDRALGDVVVMPSRDAILDAIKRADGGESVLVDAVCTRANASPLAAPIAIAVVRDFVLVSVATEAWQRTDRALTDANRFLDAIVENIPDMIFVKDAETLLFERFNRAGEQLLGWSRGELLGKTDHDFYPKEQADFFHAKDRETLRAGKLVDVPEEPIDTKHQGRRWLHTRKVPVLAEDGTPLYLLGISEDITERKAAEERAHALERELASVMRHAREAVISWALDGTIVTWNTTAESLYGVGATDAIGSLIERVMPDAAAELRAAQVRLVAGETLPLAEVTRMRGDVEIEVEESLFLVRDEARGHRIASIARDVSEIARLRRQNEILTRRGRTNAESKPESEAMRETLASADVVAADAFATVLLLGETGVGKSWLARRIHAQSPRAEKAFLELNCASLGPQLAESELFGHERGAFTSAASQKRGLVEAADGGTLFLDEIGELPAGAQAQLLTFLDARRFRRVGGTRSLTADVRVIAATNVDLAAAISAGAFRKDLYYRLSVVPIRIPPLRERRDEIPALAEQVVSDLSRRAGRAPSPIDDDALDALVRYDWPGNVRELRNALERAVILGRGGPIRRSHFPFDVPVVGRDAPKADSLVDRERDHILRTLDACGGNRTRAAERLGISRSTLKRKLAQMRVEGDE